MLINIVRKKTTPLLQALPFILPGLLLVAFFILYPMARNIAISFSDYNLIKNTLHFTGIKNYSKLLTGYQGRFWYAYRNNILYALVTTPITLFLGFVSAVMINSLKRGSNTFKTIYYFPTLTSWIVVGLVFNYLFNPGHEGLVNFLIVDVFHIVKTPINWLKQEWPGNSVIWLLGIWKGIGYPMVIYLAAITGIPQTLYEAAAMEGSGPAQNFLKITVPLVKPVTFFLIVQSIIGSFNVFLQVLLLTNGDPMGKTSALQFMMYERIFKLSLFGEGAAIGIITAVTIFLTTILLKRFLHPEETY